MGKCYTVAEVADYFNCNEELVRRMIRDKRLRAFKVGSLEWRIEAEEAEAYKKRNANK